MELLQKFDDNTCEVIDLANSFSEEDFNIKPSENEWSAADVLEHIYRSEFGIPRLFAGETAVPDREPDAYLQKMKTSLLNFDTKTKAPEVIQPKGELPEKAELLSRFEANREKISQVYAKSDPAKICLLYEHPFYGSLTRLEWLNFCILHAKRHIHQLKSIQKAL